MSQIACLGDTSSHGGSIVTASSHFRCRGAMVALDGDLLACPIHGRQELIGDSHFQIFGKLVVRVGNKARCGATIMTGASGTDLDG